MTFENNEMTNIWFVKNCIQKRKIKGMITNYNLNSKNYKKMHVGTINLT